MQRNGSSRLVLRDDVGKTSVFCEQQYNEGITNMRPWAGYLAAAFLAAGVPGTASAQAQAPAPSPATPSQDIPDQKLDAAAAALGRVAAVKENYEQRIESADPADKPRIADEANNALVKAVTDQGLSVDEYTAILVVAQTDPGVREKIVQRLRATNR
jgi:hypothetical protein